MADDLARMNMDELLAELHHQVDRIERLLFPPVPKSPKQRVAELGLRVVKDDDEGGDGDE
jgi:hypothetical protein